MIDDTEVTRRAMVKDINSNPGERAALEHVHGRVWNTQELGQDFNVHGFMAPFVVVTRKSDNIKGSMEFQHNPRYYYNFQPE